jgi:hypothetical protein
MEDAGENGAKWSIDTCMGPVVCLVYFSSYKHELLESFKMSC